MAEPKKSNFSVTCSLLSQYLKENRSFPDLGVLAQEPTKGKIFTQKKPFFFFLSFWVANIMGFEKKKLIWFCSELYRPPTTLNLLPGLEVSADNHTDTEHDTKSPPENAQLTIFFGGKVIVFDSFPSEKAADLMNLASFGSSAASATAPIKINGNNS